MLRKNTFLNSGRLLIGRVCFYRNLNENKQHEKFYIVQIKNEETAIVKAHQTQKALTDVTIKGDHWHRLRLILTEILYIYRTQFFHKIKELQVNERFSEFKNQHANKLTAALAQENVKKIIENTHSKLNAFKETKSYAKVKQLPRVSSDMIAKGNHYWILFNESKYKELLIYYIQMGKKGVVEIFKFIKHVYNAPSK
ncbi:hypothetical protein PVAND_007012 [Polypedilum vanderplanki]|uniref:Uncharacterized protein n=1 Tax=Polypedilum vanderplanki TaxID=319348 RepID=A0A9J6C6K7_POLVA|nr:hypothetical protein PVAND_007012 [Polypedilum vanderplanki]